MNRKTAEDCLVLYEDLCIVFGLYRV
jgi:hypothetical protein